MKRRGWMIRWMGPLMFHLATLFLTLGVLLGYLQNSLLNSDAFSKRLSQSLQDSAVVEFLSRELTDVIVEKNRDLTAIRPVLLLSTQAILSSDASETVVRHAVRAGHHVIFTGDGSDILLNLNDVAILLKGALSDVNPTLAEKIPAELTLQLRNVIAVDRVPAKAASILPAIVHLLQYSLWALTLGVLFLFGSLRTSRSRAELLVQLSLSFTLVATLLAMIVASVPGALHWFVPDSLLSQALSGVWISFMKGLRAWSLLLGVVGLTVLGTSFAVYFGFDLLDTVKKAAVFTFGDSGDRRVRILRASGLLLVGVATLITPKASAVILAGIAGAFLAFAGITELFMLFMKRCPVLPSLEFRDLFQPVTHRLKEVGVIVGVPSVLSVLFLLGSAGSRSLAASGEMRCNGLVALCDRPLNEAVFPTTHNSMASADHPGWLAPNQELGVVRQLKDGIRGLLMDVHYGYRARNGVVTELKNEAQARKKYEAAVGRPSLEAALRIRDRLIGVRGDKMDLYLCHGFCEAGALSFVSTLREIREFLVLNPHEVLIIVLEDHDVDPRDVTRALSESKLDNFLLRRKPSEPWPTLREMITSDQRVLLLAENDSGGVPGYHDAYRGILQETPYHFESPGKFSCKTNRGGNRGGLFLLNHWITSPPAPMPSHAERVNAREVLTNRIERCRSERGLTPNLVSVDFYRTGDLFEVVNEMNRAER